MKIKFFLFLAGFFAMVSPSAAAHEPFTLLKRETLTVTPSQLPHLRHGITTGRVDGDALRYTEKEIRLIIETGSNTDKFSFTIQGVRNPSLIIPAGAVIKVLFINTSGDLKHDIFFGHAEPPYQDKPDTSMSIGTDQLNSVKDGVFRAEEITFKAESVGQYNYFASVSGQAKNGMWGDIYIGVEPKRAAEEKRSSLHYDTEITRPPTSPADVKHNHTAAPAASPTPQSPTGHEEHQTQNGGSAPMRSSVDIGTPMTVESSGTAWVPESSPMYSYMKMYKDGGSLMIMGGAFLRYTQVGSTRDISVAGKGGRNRFDAPNMLMMMYSRPLSDRSQLGLRVMASIDPLTQRGWGYPLLYQSGELYKGLPIHDRQHPHDFISELAAAYSYKVNERQSFYFYGGIAGEPALGPPMFMHRASGMNNPDAPISHHWQDASHITWGVLTAGYNFGKFKIEASAFNGTEPDENRWAFDRVRLNSFSGRFSINPTKDLSLQVSTAYIKRPERAEPDLDHMHRTTASAVYNKAFSESQNWASTFVWGNNYKEGKSTNSFLFESDYTFGKNAIFGRLERVQKDGHELVIPHSDPIHANAFWVGTYSLGYVRDVIKDKGLDVGLGGMATFNSNPASLTPYYGGTKHAGWQMFVRFRPSRVRSH